MLITTMVVTFCKDGGGNVNVKLNPLFQTAINPQPPHTLHEKTSRALACRPDTTPA
jgi:hypothetical protein